MGWPLLVHLSLNLTACLPGVCCSAAALLLQTSRQPAWGPRVTHARLSSAELNRIGKSEIEISASKSEWIDRNVDQNRNVMHRTRNVSYTALPSDAKAKRKRSHTEQGIPNASTSEEGSLVAIIVKMSKNMWRTLMIYDEGDGFFKALRNGLNVSFSAAAMCKLHNGAGITRDVQKDEHKVCMPRSCLGMALGCHYEEWGI